MLTGRLAIVMNVLSVVTCAFTEHHGVVVDIPAESPERSASDIGSVFPFCEVWPLNMKAEAGNHNPKHFCAIPHTHIGKPSDKP